MDLTHSFQVPTAKAETWAHFNDIAALAQCFPGASVTSVEGETFHGSCKVKLGPIALVYNGSGTFLEKDEAAGRMLIEAKGKDKRGNGTAGAHVTLTMTEAGDATDVVVVTDLAITGKPAQFGRGVMQDVSDKLLGQFMDCLEQRLGRGEQAPATPAATVDEVAAPAPDAVSGEAEVPTVGVGSTYGAAAPVEPEALDLGATVLPVLLKSYWRQAAAAVLALVVLRAVLRRRHR